MKNETKDLLEKRLTETLEELEQMPKEERQQAVDEIHRLSSIILESDKTSTQEAEVIRGRWDRVWKRATEIGGIVVPAVAYVGLAVLCLNFEETGTLQSSISRSLFGKTKPGK